MNRKKLCIDLRSELIHFVDRIDAIFKDKNVPCDDLIFIRFYVTKMTPENAMQHVINKMLPWKTHINDRNDTFFDQNKTVFGELPEKKVNFFSDVWKSSFDTEDKNEVWEFLDAFIAFSEEYKKKD